MKIDPILEKDSIFITDLKLSQVRMIPDGENPWFILVPRKLDIIEWVDLSIEDQYILTEEISLISEVLKKNTRPDKINVASLGNQVPQLHVHVIARFKRDRAWPNAIWGTKSSKDFNPDSIEFWKESLK